jgi:RNA polymerase sigma factor (sigma-70 family)
MDRETTIGHLRSFVRDGSELSFRQLVAGHQALVRAAALSHLGQCRYLADDVTQEVFSTLARKAPFLKEDTHLAAWLHRVACRTASNQLRMERRRKRRESEASFQQETPDPPIPAARLVTLVHSCLDAQDPADRKLIHARFLDRQGFQSIAVSFGISEDAARMRVNRALERLRGTLRQRGGKLSPASLSVLLGAPARDSISLLHLISMSIKSKLVIAAALSVIGLLSIPVLRPLFSRAPLAHPSESANSTAQVSSSDESLTESSRTRRPRPQTAKEWKLPFRLKPRLTAEQLAILGQDPAGHLNENPEDTDVLVGWASRDPDAAIQWLKSVGEITVNDIGYYTSHLAAIGTGMFARGGMEEMLAYLEQHGVDTLRLGTKRAGNFKTDVWFSLAREDTAQEAIAYLKDHPEETDLAGAFISGITDTEQMLAAMNYFQVKGIESDVNYWMLRHRMKEDPGLFADWAATSRPDMLNDILLGWHSDNPQQLQQWIATNAGRPELAEPIQEIRDFIANDVPPSAADDDSRNDESEGKEDN